MRFDRPCELIFKRIAAPACRRLSKGIIICQNVESQYYNFVRIQIALLTSELFYDILLSLLGGKQIELPFFEMEEVMSLMNSSSKPSAVASLSEK